MRAEPGCVFVGHQGRGFGLGCAAAAAWGGVDEGAGEEGEEEEEEGGGWEAHFWRVWREFGRRLVVYVYRFKKVREESEEEIEGKREK